MFLRVYTYLSSMQSACATLRLSGSNKFFDIKGCNGQGIQQERRAHYYSSNLIRKSEKIIFVRASNRWEGDIKSGS